MNKDLYKIIKDKYILNGDFTLSSGGKEPSYFDIKSMLFEQLDSHVLLDGMLYKIGDILQNQIKFNSIVGIELGGALLTAQLVARIGTSIGFGVVRKTKREHALGKQIEGKNITSPVLLIDDVISTGHAMFNARMDCFKENIEITGFLCVINRLGIEKTKNLEKFVEFPIHSLFRELDFNE